MENKIADGGNLNTVAALTQRVAELEALVKWYESQLASAKRRQFGQSSERTDVDPRQLSMFAEPEAAPPPKPETEEISYRRAKRKGKREDDLSKLPVERVEYELPEPERACPECGGPMEGVGVDIRREIKIIPAKAVLVEHASHAYVCRGCEKTAGKSVFKKAAAPAALIPGSLASPSFVAHIASQKYSNGMPLYRLEKGFFYDGVNISRQVMSSWLIQCCELYLVAPYRALVSALLGETALHCDETAVQVLREPGRDASSKSYEWVYRTSGFSKRKIVVYEYKTTRGHEHPKAFLKGFKGILHTDGYKAYHSLPPEITVVGCWAHARRKFEDALKKIPKEARKGSDAETGVAYINALFAFEKAFAGLPPDKRKERRLEKSKPVSDAFFTWAGNLGALPKTALGEASRYALNQREYLENVFKDGRAELSNNRCERSVKPFVMGRKAWLFSNTPRGAEASSVLYTIIETAKENGLHPFRYMEHLLETLPNITTGQLEPLLPWSAELPDKCYVTPPSATAGEPANR